MTTEHPEAIKIAEWLETIGCGSWHSYSPQKASAELRRLHAEIESLRTGYDAARMEIASLQAQLEAVGAGGVEPLLPPSCWCESCDTAANNGWRSRMSLCPQCGNKRCPRAKNHTDACANAAVAAAPAQPVAAPDGWQLVPVEPTQEMVAALGFGGDKDIAIGHASISAGIEKAYRAMLAAAPQPPAQAQEDARQPLTEAQIGAAVRAAHIAFCLDKFQTFERALIHFTEQAHDIAPQQGDET